MNQADLFYTIYAFSYSTMCLEALSVSIHFHFIVFQEENEFESQQIIYFIPISLENGKQVCVLRRWFECRFERIRGCLIVDQSSQMAAGQTMQRIRVGDISQT